MLFQAGGECARLICLEAKRKEKFPSKYNGFKSTLLYFVTLIAPYVRTFGGDFKRQPARTDGAACLSRVCMWPRGDCASASHPTTPPRGVEEGACQHCSPTPRQKAAAGTAGYTVITHQEEHFTVLIKNNKNSDHIPTPANFHIS